MLHWGQYSGSRQSILLWLQPYLWGVVQWMMWETVPHTADRASLPARFPEGGLQMFQGKPSSAPLTQNQSRKTRKQKRHTQKQTHTRGGAAREVLLTSQLMVKKVMVKFFDAGSSYLSSWGTWLLIKWKCQACHRSLTLKPAPHTVLSDSSSLPLETATEWLSDTHQPGKRNMEEIRCCVTPFSASQDLLWLYIVPARSDFSHAASGISHPNKRTFPSRALRSFCMRMFLKVGVEEDLKCASAIWTADKTDMLEWLNLVHILKGVCTRVHGSALDITHLLHVQKSFWFNETSDLMVNKELSKLFRTHQGRGGLCGEKQIWQYLWLNISVMVYI